MKTIEEILIERDGLTEKEAAKQVQKARDEMYERLADGEMPFDLCDEFFGLEPDYLEDLLF